MYIPVIFLLFFLFSPETTVEKNKKTKERNLSSNGSVEIPKSNIVKLRKVGIVGLNNQLKDKKFQSKLDSRKNKYPWLKRKINYHKKNDKQQSNKKNNSVNKKVVQKTNLPNNLLSITENHKKIMERNFIKNLNIKKNSPKYKINKNKLDNKKSNELKKLDRNKLLIKPISNLSIEENHKNIMQREFLNNSGSKIETKNNELNQENEKDNINSKQNENLTTGKLLGDWVFKLDK
jgi:hypothetical protein